MGTLLAWWIQSHVHEYKRDGFGLMTEYRHNGALTTYDYDGLGRLYHSTTPDGVYDWVWDGDGSDPTQAEHLISESVTSTTIGNSKTSYDYHGPGGALTGIHRQIEGETFDTLIEHDIVTVIGQPPLPIARPKVVRFPVKNAQNQPVLEVAQYTYDKFGRVMTVWDGSSPANKYWELVKTDAYGNDAEVKLLGGTTGVVSRKIAEAATGRLSVAETLSATGAVLQRDYHQYDARGLLVAKGDVESKTVQHFVHDAYGRLEARVTNNVVHAYSYDAYGNLTRKPEVGALHYSPGKPYQLASTDSGSSFAYDTAGNGTQTLRTGNDIAGGRQEIAYTSFDLPTRVANGPIGAPASVTTYRYDANNSRTVEQVQNGPRTLHAGDGYRRVTQANNTREQIVSIPTPTGRAVEVSISDGGARTIRVLHTDHLGSTVGVTNAAGLSTERRSYDPFGKQASSGTANTVRASFTGHELDTDNRMINMRGRMYDPMIGRFTTPDPIVQSPGDSQSWNRYSYVMNSPLSFTDPSGFERETHEFGATATVKGGYSPTDAEIIDVVSQLDRVPITLPTVYIYARLAPSADAGPGTVSKVPAPAGTGMIAATARATAMREQGLRKEGLWGWIKACFDGRHVKALDESGAFVLIKGFAGGPAGAVVVEVKGVAAALRAASTAGSRVNMPAWRKIAIDMKHIAARHMPGGKDLAAGNKKDIFQGMTEDQVQSAVRHAYRNGEVLRSQGERVFVRGPMGHGSIEMWVNRATKEIESAWPKF